MTENTRFPTPPGLAPLGLSNPARTVRQTLPDCCAVRQPWIKGFPHMLVGYMRVSSADDRQSVDLQRDALLAAGVDGRHLHQDKASGARDDRPGLKAGVVQNLPKSQGLRMRFRVGCA